MSETVPTNEPAEPDETEYTSSPPEPKDGVQDPEAVEEDG